MSIIIGADFVPTKTNELIFINGNTTELVGEELLNILYNADYRIFNLEVPLADVESPISKCGPSLIASTATINGYKSIGVDCFTLANNHIMDQGVQGLNSTIKILIENKIEFVGCGNNPEEAAKAKIIDVMGNKIGIYACAEHEFSIVSDKTPGANPFDPLESLDHIVDLKRKCDYVIVLYHGGKEHYRYPSPNLQKVCRKMIEKGADLVVCQHSHCIGCEEKYKKGTIVYGQGNFLFDYYANECWKTGLLVKVNDDFSVEYIPVCKKQNTVRLANDAENKKILSEFTLRSNEILADEFVKRNYSKFAESQKEAYLMNLSGINRRLFVYRVLNRIIGSEFSELIIKYKCKKNKLVLINYLECESHRELALNAIKQI